MRSSLGSDDDHEVIRPQQYLRLLSSRLWSSSFKTILESIGESGGEPCGHPLFVFSNSPFTMTPAFSSLASRATNGSSATLRQIRRNMNPWEISSKNDCRSTVTAQVLPSFTVTIQLLQLGHWGLPLEHQDERVEKIVGLFAAGRKAGADDGKGISAGFGAETTGDFCLSLGIRRSHSAWLLSKGTRRSVRKRRTSLRCSRSHRMRLQVGDCLTRPRVPGRRGWGGWPASASVRMVS